MHCSALAVLSVVLVAVDCDVYFTYGSGIEQWGLISKYCEGERQSPIDLDTSVAKTVPDPIPLELVNVKENPINVRVKNNGHTVIFSLTYPASKGLGLRGGPLEGTFNFASLHFHWGSEHTIDTEWFPLEMHMVFYNQDYGSLHKAQFQPNGLAVLGYFFSNQSGTESRRWVDSLKSVKKAGSGYTFVHPSYMNLARIIGLKPKPYFYYRGSLTTPPCYETVSWIVQKEPLVISSAQLNLFECLKGKHGYLRGNYRPVQNLNGRTVWIYDN
ncbi:carbonic anhydrase 2-like [Ochlerotatus camptorhynchus]|uniref:carbonic anhydrase 2-like n=1 Tax=Ochlerotatus camptorhynchus TaxID=644619 RepID=UPI0031D052A2